MTLSAEHLALRHTLQVCTQHESALQDALTDLAHHTLTTTTVTSPDKEIRRLLDQFAYRYIRLQDDMGARLFPAILHVLGEDIGPMAQLDRLNRLEQLGWLESADEWADMRRIRNEFAHDYPETADERLARLQLALRTAQRALEIFSANRSRILERFPELAE